MLNNSGHPTAKVKMTVAPAGHPCQRTNGGDGRTPTVAAGVYMMNAWFGGVSSYLSLDFFDQWDELLGQMNAGKRGRPYQYLEAIH